MKPYNILVPGKYLKKVEIKLCYVCSKELITIQRLVPGGGEQVLWEQQSCSHHYEKKKILASGFSWKSFKICHTLDV